MTLDAAMGRAARLAVVGALLAATLVLVEAPEDLLAVVVIHLSGIVLFGFAAAVLLAPATDTVDAGVFRRGAVVVAAVTGVVLIVTLVASAAIGFEVSVQFLQLLSALDIAWVVAATFYGLRWRLGLGAATVGAAAIGVMCVWSIWRYLDRVGFTSEGGWLVDTDALLRLVLPLDVMAAVLALGSLWWGARHATAQRSPQS